MKTISREEFEKRNVFGTGAENTGFAQYFIGNSYLNPLTDPKNCAVFMERSYYSGFTGLIDPTGDTRLFVTLRCMQIEGGTESVAYRLYAGGGLLKDSECQSEWEETEAKMNTMRQLFKHI